MRGYLFTEVERLLAWLEDGEEDDSVEQVEPRPGMEELMGPELTKRIRQLKAATIIDVSRLNLT